MDNLNRLTDADLNSLNAIAGAVRHLLGPHAADVLIHIQCKASRMLREIEQTDCQEADKMQYVKTVNVTNTKNVLVQIPGWVVKSWGLDVGNTLEVCYDANEEEIRIRRPILTDVQGRGKAT